MGVGGGILEADIRAFRDAAGLPAGDLLGSVAANKDLRLWVPALATRLTI